MLHGDKKVIQKILYELRVGQGMLKNIPFDDPIANEIFKRIISMTLINVGGLTGSISEKTRLAYPDTPWRTITEMEDMIANKYRDACIEDDYNTVQNEFSAYEDQMNKILEDLTEKDK